MDITKREHFSFYAKRQRDVIEGKVFVSSWFLLAVSAELLEGLHEVSLSTPVPR